jgi:antitoxin CptB
MQLKIKKLHYHSWHRGTRENDLLLGRFSDDSLEKLTSEELAQYEALLNQPDSLIYDWVTGQAEAPADLTAIVGKIRVFLS